MGEEQIRAIICEVFATRIRLSENCGVDNEKMRFGRYSRLNGRICLIDEDLTDHFSAGDEILFTISDPDRDDFILYFDEIEIVSHGPRNYLEGFGVVEKIDKGSAITISNEGHGRLFTPWFAIFPRINYVEIQK